MVRSRSTEPPSSCPTGAICWLDRPERALLILIKIMHVSTIALAALTLAPVFGQSALPRTRDGKPNFSGIWQVLNSANLDLQDHGAQKDIPAGQGVVEGGEIPYQPWALAKKTE